MKQWVINNLPSNSLVKNQYQMAWTRLPFVAGCLLYTLLHTADFDEYGTLLLGFTVIYLIIHVFAATRIKITPIAPWRILGLIILDVALVSLAMIADVGAESAIFSFFFIIIFLSAYWFGISMLICAQTLSILGYIIVAAIAGIADDSSTIILHFLEILIIPAFGILLGNQSKNALSEKASVEKSTFGLLDKGPLPVFTFSLANDSSPKIRYVSQAIQHVFSGDPMKLIGESVDNLALPEDAEEMNRSCRIVFTDKNRHESHSFFIRGQNKQGALLQLMCLTARIQWQGEWVGVCFLFDITQSETRRAQMNVSMQEGYMSTLVAGIVHDFRNVLTSIIGTAEVLQFTAPDKATQEQLGIIIDAGERGSDTITHLLKLGSSDNQDEKKDNHEAMGDLQHTLNSIMELLRIQLPAHIHLHCEIDPVLPQIHFDITQLEQVLMNLINNASQAIEKEGQIIVRIGSDYGHKVALDGNPALRIRIEDNGCGIPEEDMPYITQNFWTSRKESGGTGLGLAMVKRIINNHGGELVITSQVATGTQINVYLPSLAANGVSSVQQTPKLAKSATNTQPELQNIQKSRPTAATIPPSQTSAQTSGIKPCTILLVDDSSDVLQVHCMQLEAMGHQVITAVCGDDALAIYEKQHANIHMLITDFKMPGMDGIDLALTLRQKNAALPMLMLTAYGETKKIMLAKDINMTILLKPTTFQKFTQAIVKIQKENPDSFS